MTIAFEEAEARDIQMLCDAARKSIKDFAEFLSARRDALPTAVADAAQDFLTDHAYLFESHLAGHEMSALDTLAACGELEAETSKHIRQLIDQIGSAAS